MDIEKYKAGFNPGTEENNESPVCAKCGRCCGHMSCHISPDDVRDKSVEGLIKWIEESGCVAIDWWDGDTEENGYYDEVYFMRMRHKNEAPVTGSYGGRCVFLTDKGCTIPFEYRGKGARLLVPKEGFELAECTENYTKLMCAREWRDYQDVLTKVVDHFGRHEIELSFEESLNILLGLNQ